MASGAGILRRPAATADDRSPSNFRTIGAGLGVIGLVLVVIALIGNIAAASDVGDGTRSSAETLAWTFGVTTTGLAALKLGISIVLMAILIRLWIRVDSVKASLPHLMPAERQRAAIGLFRSTHGPAVGTERAPAPLMIHRVAQLLWAPMLAIGVMLVVVGLVLAFIRSGTSNAEDFTTLGAWVQGLQFLGEGAILAGVSFLLGSILAGLRSGGGEVQEALGVTVQTLKMPPSARGFLALMMLGVVVSIAQFVLYVVAASVDEPGAWFAWLGPLRELGLGLLLLGIVLALYTIGTVLGFQFNRIRTLIETGA
jgi:hypothetical protein